MITAALLAATVQPSWASPGAGGAESAVVGSFALGDRLEATVGERDGSFTFQFPVAGVSLGWDSKAAGGNRYGLGFGLGWSLGYIETGNGLLVHAASGGVFRPDPTHASGLSGYGVEDLVFEQRQGELPARPEAGVGPVAYAYVLHELGAKTTYYNHAGDPVAAVDGFDVRTDWVWDEFVPQRLVAIVDGDGVRTGLDWDRSPGSIVVERGTNLPRPDADDAWLIELEGGRVDAVLDPMGSRVALSYDDVTGLLSGVSGATGGTTEVSWKLGDDGVARVDRVRTVDATGAELSTRAWSPAAGSTPSSGWPVFQGGEGDVFWSGDPAFRYQTELTDGATRVVSEYNSQHLLVNRKMMVTGPSGEQELQSQAHTYPGTEDGGVGDPEQLEGNWSRPSASEITYRNLQGGTRTARETFEFDDAGRRTWLSDGMLDTRIGRNPAGDPVSETYSPNVDWNAIGGEGGRGVITADREFDGFGNSVRAADGTTRTYDAGNRPTSVTTPEGETTTIAYWADGSRASLTGPAAAAGGETRFYWDEQALVNDTHASGGREGVASYLIGATRHARTTTGGDGTQTLHYGTDRHANVTELTDAGGAVVDRYRYSDYGTRSAASASDDAPDAAPQAGDLGRNPFGHAGEYHNPDGTQHLAVRTYDTEQLRFITMDTAELHNVFAFADLNPIMNVDPSGRSAKTDRGVDWAAIGMALAGAILTAISSAIVPVAGTALGLYMTGLAFAVVASATALVRHSVPQIPEDISEAMEFFETAAGAVALVFGVGAIVHTVAMAGKVTVLPEWVKHIERHLVARRGLKLEMDGYRNMIENNREGLTMSAAMRGVIPSLQRNLAGPLNELESIVAQVPQKIWQQMQAGAPAIKWNGYAAWAANYKVAARAVDAMVEIAAAEATQIQRTAGSSHELWGAIRHRIVSAAKDSFKGREASWLFRSQFAEQPESVSVSTEVSIVDNPAPAPSAARPPLQRRHSF